MSDMMSEPEIHGVNAGSKADKAHAKQLRSYVETKGYPEYPIWAWVSVEDSVAAGMNQPGVGRLLAAMINHAGAVPIEGYNVDGIPNDILYRGVWDVYPPEKGIPDQYEGARFMVACYKKEDREKCHGLDTPNLVRFYEHEFYVLSNFSAFSVWWMSLKFDTLEHAYHWEKFPNEPLIRQKIIGAKSAHDALKIATEYKNQRRPDWDEVKRPIMKSLMRAKAQQHEYVRRKLMETGTRRLVEDSWRDSYWGWGADQQGQNVCGSLWEEIREELRG